MAPRLKSSWKGFFLMTTCTLFFLKVVFILTTSFPSTEKFMMIRSHHHFDVKPAVLDDDDDQMLEFNHVSIGIHRNDDVVRVLHEERRPDTSGALLEDGGSLPPTPVADGRQHDESQLAAKRSKEKLVNNKKVFHEREIFLENYNQMNDSFKIYIYPHSKTNPYANVLLPTNHEPGGNYASESYFKIALSKSHFITKDPLKADLFFMPFSIAAMRHDKRIGVGGIKDFVREYVSRIRREYPYWNRTGGADHFYVACHSIGRTAMEKAPEVMINAIQLVCSSSYFLQAYNAHKDASIPQIWPRRGALPTRDPSERKKLAFYAGAMNSRVREYLVKTWINDTELSVHEKRIKTPYSESLLGSKFCFHAKGFEVNTARIGDAIYYGCVPVVLADHYDLPFADILNWSSFSVIVSTVDIPLLKRILKEKVDSDEYLRLQKNVLKVRNHFQWHQLPVAFDAFYMVMYELWLRRSTVRINWFSSLDQR